jgi:hypothetical protein
MDRGEKMKEAQEVLNWAIMRLNFSFNCKVLDYKYENFKAEFFTKENKLMMPVQIPEEWIKGSHRGEDRLDDRLKALLANLANY